MLLCLLCPARGFARDLTIVEVTQTGGDPTAHPRGVVFYPGQVDATGINLRSGIVLPAGTELVVPQHTRLVLADKHNNRFTAQPNSRFRLQTTPTDTSLLHVIQGAITVRVNNALDFFGLRHQQIIASVRGTTFTFVAPSMSNTPDRERVQVLVNQGVVRVERSYTATVRGNASQPTLTVTDLTRGSALGSGQSISLPTNAAGISNVFADYASARRHFEQQFFDSLGQDDVDGQFSAVRNLMAIYHDMSLPDATLGLQTACELAADATAMPGARAICLNKAGSALIQKGELDRAIQLFRTSHQTLDRAGYGSAGALRSALWNNEGVIWLKRGRPVPSLTLFADATTALQQAIGTGSHPGMANLLHNRAVAQYRTGQLARADNTIDRALRMQRQLYGTGNHHSEPASLAMLGAIRAAQGHWPDGVALNQQALRLWQQLHPTMAHPDLLLAQNRLGALFEQQAKYAEAARYYEQALQTSKRLTGRADSRIQVAPLLGLGRVRALQGDHEDARRWFEQAADLASSTLPADDPLVVSTLQAVASLDFRLGRYDKAQRRFRAILDRLPDPGSQAQIEQLARAWNNLGISQRAAGDARAASRSHQNALELRREMTGAEREMAIAQSLTNLARTNIDLGQPDIAGTQVDQALAGLSAQPGARAAELAAIALSTRSLLAERQGLYEDALRDANHALSIRRDIHGEIAHPGIAFGLAQLGRIHLRAGQYPEALARQEAALAMMQQVYPATGHADWQQTLEDTAQTLHRAGQTAQARRVQRRAEHMKRRLAQLQPD